MADVRKQTDEEERPVSELNNLEMSSVNNDDFNATGGSKVRFQDDGHQNRRSVRQSVEVDGNDDTGKEFSTFTRSWQRITVSVNVVAAS